MKYKTKHIKIVNLINKSDLKFSCCQDNFITFLCEKFQLDYLSAKLISDQFSNEEKSKLMSEIKTSVGFNKLLFLLIQDQNYLLNQLKGVDDTYSSAENN